MTRSMTVRAGRRRFVACMVGVVLLTVGCSGGSSKSTAASGSSPSTGESSASSPTALTNSGQNASADDATTATALMWGPADFPSDWTSAPHKRSPDRKAVGDRLAACSGGVNVEAPVDVDAPDFTAGPFQAALGVSIQTDPATVDADLESINGPKFVDCFKAELIRGLGTKAESPGVVVDVAKMPAPAGTPPRTLAVRATVSQNGIVLVVSDIVALGSGRTELSLGFTGKARAFPDQLETDLVAGATARMTANPT